MPLCVALIASGLFGSCGDDNDDNDDNGGNSSQPSDNGNTQNTVDFTISPDKFTFVKDGGVAPFSVTSDNAVTAVSLADWIVLKRISQTNPYTYEATVDAIGDVEERTGYIAISANGGVDSVEIKQYKTVAINVSQSEFEVPTAGGDISFSVECNVDFTVEPKPSWITLNNSADGQYSFSVSANSLARQRIGSITIATADGYQNVSVVQEAGKAVVVTENSTAMDIAELMYPGWNLGNTLEAIGGETAWQKTKTSQEIIDYVQECGFNAIRIPCSWFIHATKNSEGEYVINSTWMARVKEIVDYCMKDGIFVELNDHWDNGWIEVLGFSQLSSSYTAVDQEWIDGKIVIMKQLWTQIANEFKDYDNHLLFAGLNEPFQQYDLFNGRHADLVSILEQYNQAFVDAVRATGGNNTNRILVVQGPGASLWDTESMLTMPTDVVENKLMVEGHYYEPWNFCGQESGSIAYTWNAESTVKSLMEKLRAKFSDKGIPVLIGEYGVNWRDYKDQEKHDASVKEFFKALSLHGPNNGCLPFAWDINSCKTTRGIGGTMTIIDRANLQIYCAPAYEGIMEGTAEAVWMK